jgi:hypothetical protein
VRQLRQEANFGCARCGCPVIDSAHIIPYRKTKAFPPEDMVSLCPTHHRMADDGKYPEEFLRELKANPHNKVHVKETFVIMGEKLVVNLAGSKFTNVPTILRINDFDLISIRRGSGKHILLDVSFFDRYNRWVAAISDNMWSVDTTTIWDVEYRSQHLKLRSAPRKILFDVWIDKGEVFLAGTLYYRGFPVYITKESLRIGNHVIRVFNMEGGSVGIMCNI